MPRATVITNPAALLTARRTTGLTQEELAHRTGIGINTIRRMEKGVKPCSVVHVRTVAQSLGIGYVEALSDDAAVEEGFGREQTTPPPLAAILYADGIADQRVKDLFVERARNAGARIVQQSGDRALATFDSVVGATSCAIGIQSAAAALRAAHGGDSGLVFQLGVDVGEVALEGGAVTGGGVDGTARLAGSAPPGGVSVSAAVREQAAGRVDAEFEYLGPREGGGRSVEAFRVGTGAGDASEGDTTSSPPMAALGSYPSVIAAASEDESTMDISVPDLPSLMILPFESLSGAPEDAALVHGLQLAIQSVLVKLPGLFLIGAAVPESYRGRGISALRAGNEVGTRYVLEGAVHLSGGRARATVQLTDTLEARIAWAEIYDRVVEDIFAIQDDIADGVVTALHVELIRASNTTELKWWQESLPSFSARKQVLRGLSHQYRGTKEDNERARELFEELAGELAQSRQGQALALIALTHWADAFRGWSSSPEASLARAAELAQRAIELGDVDGWAHLVLGYIRLLERRHDEALSLSEHAADSRPSCPMAGAIRAEVLRYCDEPEKAVDVVKAAVRKARVYPPWMLNILAASYRDSGRISRSLAVALEGRRLAPDGLDGLIVLAADYSLSGLAEEARRTAQAILHADPGFSVARYCRDQPYRRRHALDAVADALRRAGLPE